MKMEEGRKESEKITDFSRGEMADGVCEQEHSQVNCGVNTGHYKYYFKQSKERKHAFHKELECSTRD